MQLLVRHIRNVDTIFNSAAAIAAEDLPPRAATAELEQQIVERLHARDIMTDLVIPAGVEKRRFAIVQQLEDQLVELRRRVRKRRRRHLV